MMRAASIALAAAVLSAAWLGPLPALSTRSFAAHMTIHIAVVAVAAPLAALALAGTAADPVRRVPLLAAPIQASLFELAVVWAWHLPVLHRAARAESWTFALEQGSFAFAGFLLWMAALGGNPEQRRLRAGSSVAALLFTSMHMTLAGALFALANRPLFQHASGADALSALADQQLGGVIMLLVGGVSYLAGGLALTAVALGSPDALAGRELKA
jgi:putative membrane protein